MKQALIAKGSAVAQTDQTALAMLYGMVKHQAGVLYFNHIFWVIGITFFSITPLPLLLKRPGQRQKGSMGH